MATVIDIHNPCKTRVLRVATEECKGDVWELADVTLLAPGEEISIELRRDQRRVELREVPTWAKTLIESCRAA